MPPFRDLLRAHREAMGWSQYTLARESGINHSLISRMESGERGPTEHSLGRLCRALTLATPERDALYLAARLIPPGVALDTLARLVGRVRAGDLRLLLEDEALLAAALELARAARASAETGQRTSEAA